MLEKGSDDCRSADVVALDPKGSIDQDVVSLWLSPEYTQTVDLSQASQDLPL